MPADPIPQATARERRLLARVRALLRLIDTVPYRDPTGLRLGDAVPVIESLRAEVADD